MNTTGNLPSMKNMQVAKQPPKPTGAGMRRDKPKPVRKGFGAGIRR